MEKIAMYTSKWSMILSTVLAILTLFVVVVVPGSLAALRKCCPSGQALAWSDATTCVTIQPRIDDWSPFYFDGEYGGGDNNDSSSPEETTLFSTLIENNRSDYYYWAGAEFGLNCGEDETNTTLIRHWIFPYQLHKLPKLGVYFAIAEADVRFARGGGVWRRFSGNDEWEEMTRDFCVDGLIKPEDDLRIPREQFVIQACERPHIYLIPGVLTTFRIIAGFLIIGSISPFLHVLIYGLLWKEQNLHGWTVVMFCLSVFLADWGYILGILEGVKFTLQKGSWCIFLRVFTHYADFAAWAWLTLMSFDVWNTLKSMTPRAGRSKGMKQFARYCCVGFGVPTVLISVSLSMEFSFGYFDGRVVRPQYGQLNCASFESPAGFLYYDTIPSAFLYGLNLVFAALALRLIWRAHADSKKITSSKIKLPLAQTKRVGKLLLLTGANRILEMVLRHVKSDYFESAAGFWVLLGLRFTLIVYNVLQPWLIFYVFVWRKEIKSQLSAKYPVIKRAFAWIEKRGGCSGEKGMSGEQPSTKSESKDMSDFNSSRKTSTTSASTMDHHHDDRTTDLKLSLD